MRSLRVSACLHMADARGSALFSQPSTPETQRFQSRSLGWCPATPTSATHHEEAALYAAEEWNYGYADEEGAPPVQRTNPGYVTLLPPQDDSASVCTPRTVCQSRSRECPGQEHSHPLLISQHTEQASAVSQQLSPCSFMPSIGDAPVVRRVRSLSCLSANRSVAPARYSVGYGTDGIGTGESVGRSTAVLSGVGPAGVNICGTPSAVAVTRRAVPLHSTLATAAFSMANQHGHPLQEGNDGVSYVPASGSNDIVLLQTYATQPFAASSVPRLTRLSLSSSGQSPAVQTNWSIGRPTTLRCRDTDSVVHCDWGAVQSEEEEETGPWIGGGTQVCRGSAEVRALLQCSHDAEEQEERTLIGVPTSYPGGHLKIVRGLFASSPPAPLPISFSASQIELSDCCQDNAVLLSGVPMASTEEETHSDVPEATQSKAIPTLGGIAAKGSNGSFADLEAAPRKSYARSDCGTPPASTFEPPQKLGNPHRCGCVVNGVHAGARFTSRVVASEANAHHFGEPFSSNVGSDCSSCVGFAAAWRDHTCNTTPQGRGVRVEAPNQLKGSEGSTSTTKAEAVASRLAHISIHASPTPKRLAFEEEELLERGSDGDSPTLIPATRFGAYGAARQRVGSNASAAPACDGFSVASLLGRGTGDLRGSGPRWSSTFDGSAYCESFSSHIPSGLQLLRSRKRCLAEMQATDTPERSAKALTARGRNTTGDTICRVPGGLGSVDLTTSFESLGGEEEEEDTVAVAVAEEAMKRQRLEEHRRSVLQHLFPSTSSRMEDLAPAPVRAFGMVVDPCLSVPSLHVRSALRASQSAKDQQSQQQRIYSGDAASWSQVSSIDCVSPASQSTSMGLWGMPGAISQGHHSGATMFFAGSCPQLLTPHPPNVTPQPSRKH
ncbi:hypothetical protein MNV84_08215 [Leishmania braziliensis]|nr:hypothetical protein MNV84_08215 [Leishmania braziliensis]